MKKLQISLGSAALFAFVNLPQTYSITDSLIPNQSLYNSLTKCPTTAGIVIHTIIFFILTFLSMWGADVGVFTKLKHTIYGTLIFFLISNPVTYSTVASLLGEWVADRNGCPTLAGVVLHTLVYAAALFGVMFLPN